MSSKLRTEKKNEEPQVTRPPDGINSEHVKALRSSTGSDSCLANLAGAVSGFVEIDQFEDYYTFDILKSAYLQNAAVNVAFSNGKIRSVWFRTNGDLTEPTPTSVNIPDTLPPTTISNVYSTSSSEPGPMAYIDFKVNGIEIGWVRIKNAGHPGETQGINMLNTLDAARSKHKQVLLTTSSFDVQITSAEIVT